MCLVIVSVGILGFGVITVAGCRRRQLADRREWAGIDRSGPVRWANRADPVSRGERWAYSVLWFYPVVWVVHLVAELPPGKDHIHQVVFIVLSAAGLLLPVRDIIGAGRPPAPRTRSGT